MFYYAYYMPPIPAELQDFNFPMCSIEEGYIVLESGHGFKFVLSLHDHVHYIRIIKHLFVAILLCALVYSTTFPLQSSSCL